MTRKRSDWLGSRVPAIAIGLLLAPFLATSEARAATLIVDEGQLLGASGVDVGGNLYDVEFHDGTCAEWFEGCDSLADFPFATPSEGSLASQALLDQVLIDSVSLGLFDSRPILTNGCGVGSASDACFVVTPVDFRDPVGLVFNTTLNQSDLLPDNTLQLSLSAVGPNTVLGAGFTYATWSPSPQPVPGPGLLLGVGLLVVGIRVVRKP